MVAFRVLQRLLLLLSLPAAGGTLTAEMQAVLDKHNVYRCMHNVPLFTWDAAIAANAQAWADNGVYVHSENSQRVVNGENCGENLAWGQPTFTGVQSVVAWYEEIKYTDPYGTVDSFTDSSPPGKDIGHYTQVVWKSSTKLGCGKGRASVGGKAGDFWVCQYGPWGNTMGQFTTQVLAPTKSVTECGGSSSDVPSASDGSGPQHSMCTPSPLLPTGALCVYGFQCESKFCCPRLKVCLRDANHAISSHDLKVKAAEKTNMMFVVFGSGGTCKNSYTNRQQCMNTAEGRPTSSWNQAACGCKADYMTRYEAGTWVTLNDVAGLVCNVGGGSGNENGGDQDPAPGSASLAVRGKAELPTLLVGGLAAVLAL